MLLSSKIRKTAGPPSPLEASARERDDFLSVAKVRVLEARTVVEKNPSLSVQGDPGQSNQVSRDDYATAFTNLGALDPIYDPEMLAILFEHSNSLRQNVDSYATNIDGFGHRFDPIVDLESPDIDARISDALVFGQMVKNPQAEVKEPTPDEVKTAKEQIAREMRFEKMKLEHFFEFCSHEISFVTLRRWTRQDLEVMGNSFWEVIRDAAGRPSHFIYVPAFTIRLLPMDPELTDYKQIVRISDLEFDDLDVHKRFRRYVQIVEGRSVFFKEYGDPRLISTETGIAWPDEASMRAQEPKARAANELLHFKIHSPRSAYGVPRWIGNLLGVIGSRQAEEVNFNYFENKSVPPLAILISGGRMTENSVQRVQDYIEANLKGKRNFHKILIVEAESGDKQNEANAARMKIDIKPLNAAQHNDALFQNYDERNIDKVGQSFRLPRMLRGDIRDFNRATADAALTFAEVQVFEPERQEFDFIMNRRIVVGMLKIKFWRMVSLAPVIRDAVSMSEIIKNLSNANVLTPEEARVLAGDVFNRQFKRINAKWVKQPGAFTIAGIPVEEGGVLPEPGANEGYDDANFGPGGGTVAPDKPPGEGIQARARKKLYGALASEAARLLALRKALEEGGQEAWTRGLLEANRNGG